MNTQKMTLKNWSQSQKNGSKNHLMKTIFINKLAQAFKEYMLAKEPATFQKANNTVVSLWRRKYPEGGIPLKLKSVLPIESKFGFEENSELS